MVVNEPIRHGAVKLSNLFDEPKALCGLAIAEQ
jgi:hypothetical protein